jgi:hypothetical protein
MDSERSILVILVVRELLSVHVRQLDDVMDKEIYEQQRRQPHRMVDLLWWWSFRKKEKDEISCRIHSNRMDQMELSIFLHSTKSPYG